MGLFDLVADVVTIATAPVKVAATVAGAVVKPVAKGAKVIVEEVEDLLD